MSTITFDFRHYYRKGERRESDQIAYQWDLGHVAEIYVPVNATYEIHYCFADFTETDDYAVESTTAAEDGGYKLTAHIPNKYFERSGELKVYVIGSDDNHVLTTYEGYISIRGRIKPDDYTDDDPENEATRILAEAREARDAAIEAAEQAEAAASQSAAQASIAEVYDTTKTYAIGDYCLYDGQLYECTTEITTPEAWTAAHWTAATVGTELNDIKGDVTGLKEDYIDILNSAYVTDTASGSIASFPDGADNVPVKSLKVNIEPVQDLHGYDSPWPGGGGKNLIPMTLAGIKAANTGGIWSGNDYTQNGVTFTVNTNSSGDVVGITVNGTATANTELSLISNGQSFLSNGDYIFSGGYSSVIRIFYYNGNAYYDTKPNPINITIDGTETNARCTCVITSGTTASNAVLLPMIRKSTETDPTFEPYSNICPITGWTVCNVSRAGKNLLLMTVDGIKAANTGTWSGNSYTTHGVTFTIQTDSDGNVAGIMINGTTPSDYNAELNLYANNSFYLPNGDYVLNGAYSDSCRIFFYTGKRYYDSKPNPVSFTIDGTETANRCAVTIIKNTTVNNAVVYPMIRLASDADPTYEPSQSKDISITFPTAAGTVYGGTLYAGTGVLTVTYAYLDINADYLVSNQTSEGGLHWVDTRSTSFDRTKQSYCSIFPRKDGSQGWSSTSPCYSIQQNGNIRIYCNVSTKEQFKAEYADLQIACGLINSTEFQLSANEISTLLGQNNIWADTGDTEVAYRADTKLYIEKLTAPTEDDMIADHAIEANTFFMIGNTLYRAKAAIASGAIITVGTNATKLSLSDALNALA